MPKERDPNSLRRTGWRGPLLPGWCQDLAGVILGRDEFKKKGFKDVVVAALLAFATEEERSQIEELENNNPKK
jgi:hypothetical protein